MSENVVRLPSAEEMTDKLHGWLERYRVPGAAIAWMHGAEVQSAAAGVININTGVEVTPDTLFQIGSITKVYTTTLIMQLVDEGQLDIEAPALAYLPELRLGDPAATKSVTLRHLLTHTSGLDGDLFEDYGRGNDCVEKLVAACADVPLVFRPGEMFSYCNVGFVILGRIIETITGMSWDKALRTRLLEPLGVDHTVTLPEEALRFRTAAGHGFNQQLELELSPYWSMPRAMGPAGATPCATVTDLLAFAKMHIDGGVGAGGSRILSEASARAMREVQYTLPPVVDDDATAWGLGWATFDWGALRIIGHNGGTVGQVSALRAIPERDFAVAVLTNASPTGGLLADRAIRWLFEAIGVAVPPRAAPPKTPVVLDLEPYVGAYERFGFRSEVARKGEGLTIHHKNTSALASLGLDSPPNDLIAYGPDLFLEHFPQLGIYTPVRFFETGGGKSQYMSAVRVARRVGEPD